MKSDCDFKVCEKILITIEEVKLIFIYRALQGGESF